MGNITKSKRVAFVTDPGHDPILQGGVFEYADKHGWTMVVNPYQSGTSLKWVQHEAEIDGVLGFIHQADVSTILSTGLPVVSVSNTGNPLLPTVTSDGVKTGAMGAAHLIHAHRFRRLGYFGRRGLPFSQDRCLGFARVAEKAGCDYSVWLTVGRPQSYHWKRECDGLDAWLGTLRPPVGILLSDDALAFPLMESCRRLGFGVPEDVAVVGVNNFPWVCESTRPMLTSIDMNRARIGREAATLLDRLMNGASRPAAPLLIPPVGVVQRQSSDTLAIDDPDVSAVVRYVRQNIAEPFGVTDLVHEAGWSRRKLEAGIRQWLGCSPLQFINRTRVEHARRLLDANPKAKLSVIAAASGFATVDHMRLLFMKHAHVRPSAYRKAVAGSRQSIVAKKAASFGF